VSDLYIPRIGLPIFSSRIGRPILGKYKMLRDTEMYELEMRPRSFFSGNTKIGFSAQCNSQPLSSPQPEVFSWEVENAQQRRRSSLVYFMGNIHCLIQKSIKWKGVMIEKRRYAQEMTI
jgi:hypothetical protein